MILLKPFMYVVLYCGLQRFSQFIMLWSKDETMLWLLQYSFLYAERHSLSPGIFKEVSAIINKLKKLRVKYKTEKGKLKKGGTSRPKTDGNFLKRWTQSIKRTRLSSLHMLLTAARKAVNLICQMKKLQALKEVARNLHCLARKAPWNQGGWNE